MRSDIFISASAGTGKTYNLVKNYIEVFEEAFRHGEALDVHNVVAITFTNKAAKEMKDRVISRIDERIALGHPGKWKTLRNRLTYAWISTIHSFCERLLRESALFLGIDPGFQILSGMKRVMLEQQTVRGFFEENLERLEPLIELTGLDEAFKIFRDSLSKLRHELAVHPSPAGYSSLELGEHAEKVMAGSECFCVNFRELLDRYEARSYRMGLVDFDQLLTKTRDLLVEMPQVREKYRERFKYILVDEFQDTDELQSEIVSLLRKGGMNYCLFVGDAKQSIYRFRGADVTVFNRTMDEFKSGGLEPLHLAVNRRSHPTLVEFQNHIFQKIMPPDYSGDYFRSVYEKEVEALPYESDEPLERIRLIRSETSDDSRTVAAAIRALLEEEIHFRRKDGSCLKRKIKPGDIAILLRTFSRISNYERALEELNIPYYTIGSKNFYDRPEVAGPLAWLDLLVDPLDDWNFVTFLLSPSFACSLDDILSLRSLQGSKGRPLYYALQESREGKFLHLKELFDKFAQLKHVLSPSEILERFVSEIDYLARLATLNGAERMIANVRKMLELARELDRLGSSLRELSSNLKAFVDSSEESEASLETEESDSVKIMTVHKSKGLEFPVVVLADLFWKEKGSLRRILFDDKGFIIVKEGSGRKNDEETVPGRLTHREEQKSFEEEKRTLYVALSRARDMLLMSANGRGNATRPWSRMLGGTLLDIESGELLPEMEDIVSHFEPVRLPPLPQKEVEEGYGLPDDRYVLPVEDRSYVKYLSPTAITADIDDEFELSDSDGDAGLGRKSMDLGTLAHSLLEPLGIRGMHGTSPSLGAILEGGMPATVDRIRFTREDLDGVKRVLDRLRGHRIVKEIEESRRAMSEVHFQHGFRKYVLMGIVDKLYLKDGEWKIVDFKFARKNPSNIDKYRFQMEFYLYMLRELLSPVEATLFFLKDGETETVRPARPGVFEKKLLEKIIGSGGDRGES